METTSFRYPDALVTADWLSAHLEDPGLRIYDCTTYLRYTPGTGKPYTVESGRADYDAGHIPNSAFLDLQADLSDNRSGLRFTILPPDALADRFAAHGIGDDSRVILYSRGNMQWATRVWWMLRYVGFDNAAILDGGWDNWAIDGRSVSTTATRYPAANLTADPRPDLFVGKDLTRAAIGDTSACILNALAPDLHSGANDRYGRPGRIPGSVNVPAADLQIGERRLFADPGIVASKFAAVGADPAKRIVIYCGGGIAATLDAYLMHQLGYEDLAVYDNSMSEWANDPELPIETD
ncbi:MAG: sulfurtransferase [Hyphomicrobiaceae bacterium]|nr:sulfurtransferase [Hyphomicrobiaceae bacterium]